jgi:single-stranded DNA-binding protein
MIAVDGKLQNRFLQSPNGDRRILVEIHADDVRFLEGAKPRSEQDDRDQSREGSEVRGADPDSGDEMIAQSESGETDSGNNEEDASWFTDENDGTPLEFDN